MDRTSVKRAFASDTGFPFATQLKRQKLSMNGSSYGYGSRRGAYGRSAYNMNYGTTNYSGYRRRNGGPYRALTYGSRHTNPVYPKPELKFFDATSGLTNVPNTGILSVPLNDPAQGTGGQQRLGQTVAVKSCTYRLDIRQAAAGALPSTVRAMLIWDKQPNGALPAVADVLQTVDFTSFLNMANRERFVVLRNDYVSLSPQGDQVVYIERFVKINMLTQYLDGATPTPPAYDIQTGMLFLLFISDQPTTLPRLSFGARTRYMDN